MRFTCVADCPETMLGRLKACPKPEETPAWLEADKDISGGLRLPLHVREELRKLGLPLAAYTRGELEAILAACAFDARLVDDPNGINLWDKLTLTEREKMEDKGETDVDPWRGKPLHPLQAGNGFCNELRKQRLHLSENENDNQELPSV